jgi:hypothetical protein
VGDRAFYNFSGVLVSTGRIEDYDYAGSYDSQFSICFANNVFPSSLRSALSVTITNIDATPLLETYFPRCYQEGFPHFGKPTPFSNMTIIQGRALRKYAKEIIRDCKKDVSHLMIKYGPKPIERIREEVYGLLNLKFDANRMLRYVKNPNRFLNSSENKHF